MLQNQPASRSSNTKSAQPQSPQPHSNSSLRFLDLTTQDAVFQRASQIQKEAEQSCIHGSKPSLPQSLWETINQGGFFLELDAEIHRARDRIQLHNRQHAEAILIESDTLGDRDYLLHPDLLDFPTGQHLHQLFPLAPDQLVMIDLEDSLDQQETATVHPYLRRRFSAEYICDHLSNGEGRLLQQHYVPIGSRGWGLHSHTSLCSDKSDVAAIDHTLRTWSGPEFSDVYTVRHAFQNQFPFIPAPIQDTYSPRCGWSRGIQASGYLVPFGSVEAHIEIVVSLISQLRAGEIGAARLTLSGPIDRSFMAWLDSHVGYSGSVSHQDLLGELEIVYLLPLPSGAEFPLVLHRGRVGEFSKQHSYPHSGELSHEDREFIETFQKIVFGSLGRSPLEHFLKSDWSIDDCPSTITELQEAIKSWNDELKRRFSCAPVQQYDRGTVLLSDCSLTETNLADVIIAELEIIPTCVPDTKRTYFTLSDSEREEFLSTYLYELQDLCEKERARIQDWSMNNSYQNLLAALEWEGPEGGYQLTLRYAIMDKIVDYRRHQRFQHITDIRAKGSKTAPHSESIGRSYSSREGIFTPAEMTTELKKYEQRGYCYARINDPQNNEGIEYWELSSVETPFQEKIDQITFLRAIQHIEQEELASSEGLSRAVQQIREIEQRISQFRKAKKAELAALHESLLQQCSGATLATKMREGAQGLDQRLFDLTEEQKRVYSDFRQELLHTFPNLYAQVAPVLQDIQKGCLAELSVTVRHDLDVVWSHQALHPGDPSRVVHAQHTGGLGCLFPGRLLLSFGEPQTFYSVGEWQNAELLAAKEPRPRWRVLSVDTGSGHFQPDRRCLRFAKVFLPPLFEEIGISCSGTKWLDVRAPGMSMPLPIL